jgi:glutamate/tyrosine decarboxylase-like PLP-dependent enzyme
MTALFPPEAERLAWDHGLTQKLAAALRRVRAGPVAAATDQEAFAAELAGFTFDQPQDLSRLLDWTIARLETGLVHLTHPGYLGLFNPAPTFPALCADRIANAFNPQLASATTSPAAVAIEAHTAGALARRAGLGHQAVGHFCSGGSEANFTALICALTRACPGFAETGARAYPGPPVFYISADSHLAWIKIGLEAGIGRAAARLVPTDSAGRMDIAALAAAIAADRAAGAVPVMVAATAGTTNAGMVDPLPECAAIAADHRAWFHVDAAWGGGALASDRLRPLLAGIERADSVTIDAHKWFATTMGAGIFLTADPKILSVAFNVATSFMPSHAADIDPYVTTAQWSRRFIGLRLFLSLAAGGWAAYAAHVEHAADLIADLAAQLTARGWTVRNDPALAVLCVTPPPGAPPVKELAARANAAGAIWVSAAKFAGADVIRACVTHGETAAADIARAVEALENALQINQTSAKLSPVFAKEGSRH